MYDSQITFVLDTICPWTFIAKKRLDQALAQVRASSASPAVTFRLHFDPYQLHPDLPATVDKQQWYLHNIHRDDESVQRVYQLHMASLFADLNTTPSFGGELGNTFNAHRIIQHFQAEKGPDVASKLVDALYSRYFTRERHPAADDTLIESCVEAGVDEDVARQVVQDKSVGERDVKARIREVGMDVDAVPVVTVEGRRRDITLTGAKEVKDYVKALETVVKEST